MNIVFNLSTMKAGGGKNVAMNFLYAYLKMEVKHRASFFFARNSDPHLFLKTSGINEYYVVPNNAILRIIYEATIGSLIIYFINADIVYSYFGFGIYLSKVPQVSGSADSNLFFPEVDFWAEVRGPRRLFKMLIDQYRIFGLRRSTAVVFENEILAERASKLYGLENVKVILPSINFDFDNTELELPVSKCNSNFKGLFLCGWHPNKNLSIVPKIAAELKRRDIFITFVVTASPDNSSVSRNFMDQVDSCDVSEMISLIGPVRKEKLKSLYDQVDIVFLLSKLESFSNNIIESWFFKKPLVVSDELWSRSICGDAAMYVERDSVDSICNMIVLLLSEHSLRAQIVMNGTTRIGFYPEIVERINLEILYLENVLEAFKALPGR